MLFVTKECIKMKHVYIYEYDKPNNYITIAVLNLVNNLLKNIKKLNLFSQTKKKCILIFLSIFKKTQNVFISK